MHEGARGNASPSLMLTVSLSIQLGKWLNELCKFCEKKHPDAVARNEKKVYASKSNDEILSLELLRGIK